MKVPQKLGLILFLSVFMLAGIAIAHVTVTDILTSREAESWPTATGVVTKSEIRRARTKKRRHDLEYRFVVDGMAYRGHRDTLRSGLIRHRTTERAAMYPVGREVVVFYHPQNPNNSTLDTRIYWPGVLFHGVAALLLLTVSVGGIYWVLRR